MRKSILITVASVIICSAVNLYGMDLEPIKFEVRNKAGEDVQLEVVADKSEGQAREVHFGDEEPVGDAESKRAFYAKLFKNIKPEDLEREGEFHPQQHPILEMAGPHLQIGSGVAGLRGTVKKDVNGKLVMVPFPEVVKIPFIFPDRGVRGVVHSMRKEHFFFPDEED
jgi:hypothetical protein